VQGDRLDRKTKTVTDDKLVTIGAVPKIELLNQDNVKNINNSYKGKVYVLEFSFEMSTICKMNESMLIKRLSLKSKLWNCIDYN
jgi:protein SCO1/2